MIRALIFLMAITVPDSSRSEIATLTDGRTIILNADSTYEFAETARAIFVSLARFGEPSAWNADSRRNCGITFGIRNMMDGKLINISISLTIFDMENQPIGDLIPYSFDFENIEKNQYKETSIDVDAPCDEVKGVIIKSVSDKQCNFVGRKAEDVCLNLVTPSFSGRMPLIKM